MKNSIKKIKNIFFKPINSTSFFEDFWSGNHLLLSNRYESNPNKKYTNDEIHYIFASMAIENFDLTEIRTKIKKPLSLFEFKSTFIKQYNDEMKFPQVGVASQPKYIHKSLLAAAIGKANNKRNFVETGTFIGSSLYKICDLFFHLSSVEASKDLHIAASALFSFNKNVTLKLGDSRTFLESLSSDYLNEAVVFLDAHYSKGITSSEFGECPVIEEILILLKKAPMCIVIVDDIRTMNGKHGYPTLLKILNSLPGNLKAVIMFDQLIFSGKVSVKFPALMN